MSEQSNPRALVVKRWVKNIRIFFSQKCFQLAFPGPEKVGTSALAAILLRI